ncbi:PREDICTED: sterile alpha motif domain-containing protein 11, partial [Condylura cristata]|uniref:sterile alpha motif domain-containing protein 11 n=1 Tax=Condylura cristata TaxID=143302 RepID=UPI0006430FE2
KSLKTLVSRGILQVHPPICDCPGCRISSPVNRGRLADRRTVALPPARALKRELTPSFSAGDGGRDGSGSACGRPGLKPTPGPEPPSLTPVLLVSENRASPGGQAALWRCGTAPREPSGSGDLTLLGQGQRQRGDLRGKRPGRPAQTRGDRPLEKRARSQSPQEAALLSDLGPATAPEHYRRLVSALSEASCFQDPQRLYHLVPGPGRWPPGTVPPLTSLAHAPATRPSRPARELPARGWQARAWASCWAEACRAQKALERPVHPGAAGKGAALPPLARPARRSSTESLNNSPNVNNLKISLFNCFPGLPGAACGGGGGARALSLEAPLCPAGGPEQLQPRGAMLVLRHSSTPLLALSPQGARGTPTPPQEVAHRVPGKGSPDLASAGPGQSEQAEAGLRAPDGSEEPPRDSDGEDEAAAGGPGPTEAGAEGKGLLSGATLPSPVPLGSRCAASPYLHTGGLLMDGEVAVAHEDISKWTVDDVCSFVGGLPGCGEYAPVFRAQGIDGEALPLLTEEHLLTTMGLKLGPALKIRAQVRAGRAGQP